MSMNDVITDFTDYAFGQYKLIPRGDDLFYVATEFFFDDGDEFVIYLAKESNRWVLSDNCHTYRYLSYTLEPKDIHANRRGEIIRKVRTQYGIEDRDGELILDLSQDRYVGRYGEALHNFIQAIQKIASVLYWVRYRVNRTFKRDFSERLKQVLGESRFDIDWHDPKIDPNKEYTVDCRINGVPNPLFVYTVTTETKIRDAIIAWRWFESQNVNFTPFGIFKSDNLINSRQFTKMKHICEHYEIGINNSARAIDGYVKNLKIS